MDEILYGLPINPRYISSLAALRSHVRIQLMIDNEQQVAALERFEAPEPWDVFIKLDIGSHRAGVETSSVSLQKLVKRIETSPSTRLYGLYCHAGHSYGGRTRVEAENTLQDELAGVITAAKLVPTDRRDHYLDRFDADGTCSQESVGLGSFESEVGVACWYGRTIP